jgi:translation elongation factor EF-1alpha
VPVKVQTVQRYRVPCRVARAGQSASLSIGNPDNLHEKLRKVRRVRSFIWNSDDLFKLTSLKGMVLVSEKLNPQACRQFEAEIYLLYHSNGISKGLQATLHIQNVCQTAQINSMDKVSE